MGLSRIIPFIDNFVEYYAVGTIIEAQELSKLTDKDVLILMPIIANNTNYTYNKNHIFTISSINLCKNIDKFFNESFYRAHIKVNTGMNRYGVDSIKEYREITSLAKKLKINVEGEYTHLSTFDKDYCKKQIAYFFDVTCKSKLNKHITFREQVDSFNDFDCVRSGINVLVGEKSDIGLKQIFKIYGLVDKIRVVKKGQYIGYNLAYFAKNDVRIAIIRFGYSDMAIKRGANKVNIIVNGKKCAIIGVAMDVMFAKIHDILCNEGDYAEIVGFDDDNDIYTYSNCTELSSYELLTTFNNKEN